MIQSNVISTKQGIANAAGASLSEVSIISIESVATRRRHLLAESIRIDVEVAANSTSAADSMVKKLTTESIDTQFKNAGLPKAQILSPPESVVVPLTQSGVDGIVGIIAGIIAGTLLCCVCVGICLKCSRMSSKVANKAGDVEGFPGNRELDSGREVGNQQPQALSTESEVQAIEVCVHVQNLYRCLCVSKCMYVCILCISNWNIFIHRVYIKYGSAFCE